MPALRINSACCSGSSAGSCHDVSLRGAGVSSVFEHTMEMSTELYETEVESVLVD